MSQISCMSFNILACDTHSSGWELPPQRHSYIMQTIAREDPDLLGIQEACDASCYAKPEHMEKRGCADWNWCNTMLESVCKLGYKAVALRDQQGFEREKMNIGCGLIIFYKQDRFEVLEDGCESFAHDPVRYFQWVKLLDKKYDRRILFTNTHFSINRKVCDAKSGVAGEAFRTVQSVNLLNFWYKNCQADTALFATGDYNSLPTSTCQTLLRSNVFKPSQIVAETSDERGTMHLRKAAHTIDYCYVNTNAQNVTEYKVCADWFGTAPSERFPRAGYASDHRAIMTYCDYKEIHNENE